MKKLFSAFAILTAFALFTTSCKDDETTPAEDIPVAEVKITPATASVVAGTTLELKAQVLPENASDKTVTWGVQGDEKIASIDKKTGVVTGLSVGEIRVYAISNNKKMGFCQLTVTAAPIRVESVSIGEDFPLVAGKTKQLTATITPANATDQNVVWESGTPTVASVSETGMVTALTEGEAVITATVDEKSASCKVTVSIADITAIAMPYMDAIQGNTVKMTAKGFKAGDKVKLEAVAGEEYSADADVTNVTADDATFELPAAATRDRSYKVTVMRGAAIKAIAYLHPDNQFVRLPHALGHFMTGDNEVVDNDPALAQTQGNFATGRRGYVPGKIFELDEATGEFMVWKKDAALITPNFGTNKSFDMAYAKNITNIDVLKGVFDLSGATYIFLADSYLTSVDMTMFPGATILHAWAGSPEYSTIETVNFGTYTNDESASKLMQFNLNGQALKGTLDVRNCVNLNGDLAVTGCQNLTGINFGKAVGDASKDDRMIPVYAIIASNCNIKEIDISNCGRVRRLLLDGNKIERANLVNNALGDGANSGRPDDWFPYVYILKNPEDLKIDWASAADAAGRDRVINVEHYWYRNLSSANHNENAIKDENGNVTGYKSFEKWVNNSPVVKALKDGFKVIDWSYALEGYGSGVEIKHTHTSIEDLCAAEQDFE